MGLFVKLLGLAVAAGAGYASVKVARKYEENKKKDILDEEFDVETEKSTFTDVKKAAYDVYAETSEKVKKTVADTAENIGIDTKEVGEAFNQAGTAAAAVGKAVANASGKVADKVKAEAPAVIDSTKEKVSVATDKVKEVVANTADKFTAKDKDVEVTDAEVYVDVDVVEKVAEDVADEVIDEQDEVVEAIEKEIDPFEVEDEEAKG